MNREKSKNLRQFGFILSGYYIFFFYLFSKLHHHLIQFDKKWFLLPIFMIIFLIFPVILIPVNNLWNFILKLLNWVNTRILFGIIFFFIFSPIAFFKKLIGTDSFSLKFDRNVTTYRTLTTSRDNDPRNPY